MRTLAVVVLVLAACTPTTSTGAPSPTASGPLDSPASAAPPTPSSLVVTSAAPTPSPLAAVAFAVDASAAWPVVLYEAGTGIIRQHTESAVKDIARPCAGIYRLAARPPGLLAWCRDPSTGREELHSISIPGGRAVRLAADAIGSWPADVSPDGRSVAAFRLGDCTGPAPACQTRAVLIDLASRSERELVPSGYHLGATLQWTALGLTFFQPECSESGCAGLGEKGGTFVWDGSAFKRWSELRFVASVGPWTLLERMRSFSDRSDQRAAVIRGPQGERTLTAGHALAISEHGEALVWTPGPEQLTRFAPDGRILWQAPLSGEVVRAVGNDALLVQSGSSAIEIYDLRRMLRFTPSISSGAVAAVAR